MHLSQIFYPPRFRIFSPKDSKELFVPKNSAARHREEMGKAGKTGTGAHVSHGLRRASLEMPPRRPSSQSGFTLVELLVVLAIIAILAAVAFPVYGHFQVRANSTKCMSNLRQIGIGILTYANDNMGALPPTRHSHAANQAWVFLLAPYLGNVDEIRVSPADPRRADRLRRNGTSYIMNDLIFDIATDPFGNPLEGAVGNLMRIEQPAKTWLSFVISDNRGTGATNDHAHARQWSSWQRLLADVEVDRHRRGERAADRMKGHSHYLYADGTVRTFTPDEIFRALEEAVEEDRNIAEVNNAP